MGGSTSLASYLWIEADGVLGHVDDDVIPAADVPDLSGNGNGPASGNGAKWKTGQINGLPVLRFDGATQYYRCADCHPAAAAYCDVLLFKLNALSGTDNVILSGEAGGSRGLWNYPANDKLSVIQGNVADAFIQGAVAAGTWYLLFLFSEVQNAPAHTPTAKSHVYIASVLEAQGAEVGPPNSADYFIASYATGAPQLCASMDLAYLESFAVTPTPRQMAAIIARINGKYGLADATTFGGRAHTMFGDSISSGQSGANGTGVFLQWADSMRAQGRFWRNVGVGFLQSADLTSFAAALNARVDLTFIAKNEIDLYIGANDLLAAVAPAAFLANLDAFFAALNAQFRVVVSTVLPVFATNDADRLVYNVGIRARAVAGRVAVADWGGDAVMGQYADVFPVPNAARWAVDGIHPVTGGHAVGVPYFANASTTLDWPAARAAVPCVNGEPQIRSASA